MFLIYIGIAGVVIGLWRFDGSIWSAINVAGGVACIALGAG